MSNCNATASRRNGASRPALIDLAYAKGLPLVATNEPYFATSDDYEAHDALLCIAGGRLIAETEREQLTPDHRFKTRAEMAVLFADIPEALSFNRRDRRALRISSEDAQADPAAFHGWRRHQCRRMQPSEEAAELRRQAEEGLSRRLAVHGLSQGRTEEDYHARLAFELDVISRMNYAGYFLIVADFIKWAKSQGIPSVRAAAPAPVRWSLTRSPSPISIRSASACCSNASSIRNACRCPTSTSTSARTAAAR